MNDVVRAIAVTAKSGSTCTADIHGTVVTINVMRDLTVAIGDGLVVQRNSDGEWWALGRFGTGVIVTPTSPPAAPPPSKPTTTSGSSTINPVETRSRQASKWRTDNDDVYQGEFGNGNHVGAVFYGNRFNGLSGVTVTKATIRVRRPDRGGANAAQSTTMRLMTNKTRPGGAVTLTSSTSGPSLRRGQTASAFTIPDSWAQAMVDGTVGGLAFFDSDGSPYVIFSGRGDYSAAFSMKVNWTR